MRTIRIAMVALSLFAPTMEAMAQQNDPQGNSTQSCPIDTTTDKQTGRPRQSGTGVQVCHDDHSGSAGVSVSQDELNHFLKYPLGQSDHSVPKDIGRAIHGLYSH
jgi:hypothetical protein